MRSTSRAAALSTTMMAVLAGAAVVAAPMQANAQSKPTAQGAWGGKTNAAGHYADVNGIRLYYETHGTGKPLILLHGGLGAIEMFGSNLETLGKGGGSSPSTCRDTGALRTSIDRSASSSWLTISPR